MLSWGEMETAHSRHAVSSKKIPVNNTGLRFSELLSVFPVFLTRVLCLTFLQKKLSLGNDNWRKLPHGKLKADELQETMPKFPPLSGKMVEMLKSSPTHVHATQGFIQLTVLPLVGIPQDLLCSLVDSKTSLHTVNLVLKSYLTVILNYNSSTVI